MVKLPLWECIPWKHACGGHASSIAPLINRFQQTKLLPYHYGNAKHVAMRSKHVRSRRHEVVIWKRRSSKVFGGSSYQSCPDLPTREVCRATQMARTVDTSSFESQVFENDLVQSEASASVTRTRGSVKGNLLPYVRCYE